MVFSMMDVTEIRRLLPHRYPFLLVDRVVELTADESIVAYKNLSANEPFFEGHFPSNPIFPGVLLMEAMAQAAGILGFHSQEKTIESGTTFYFAGADNVRFKRQCVPGDRVMLRASVVSVRRGIWKFDVSSDVDGELAASATILCADR
jgi:3-hydroxyacyl-[acyl-carrier-protein] dehydratase